MNYISMSIVRIEFKCRSRGKLRTFGLNGILLLPLDDSLLGLGSLDAERTDQLYIPSFVYFFLQVTSQVRRSIRTTCITLSEWADLASDALLCLYPWSPAVNLMRWRRGVLLEVFVSPSSDDRRQNIGGAP